MHDQDIRSLGELDELWVGSVLIGAKYDRHIPSLDTIRQRQVSTGNSTAAGHLQKLTEQQPAK